MAKEKYCLKFKIAVLSSPVYAKFDRLSLCKLPQDYQQLINYHMGHMRLKRLDQNHLSSADNGP
jgi:hypothetical protein